MRKEIHFEISCDFSLSGVNYALQLAKDNELGFPLRIDYIEQDGMDRWELVCENGKVISDGFVIK
jgi:hypothetical protein